MICKSCQREIPDDSKFCTFCGAVQEASEPEPAPYQGFSEAPATPPAPDFGAAPTEGYVAAAPAAPAAAPVEGYAAAAPAAAPLPDYAPQPAPAAPAAPAQPAYGGYQGAPAAQPPQQQPQQYQQPQPPQQQPQYQQPPQQQQPQYQQPQQQYQQPPQQQQQQAYAPAYPQAAPPKKNRTGLIIGIAVAALLVLGGGIFLIVSMLGGGKGWQGGVSSSSMPSGYAAIVDNEYVAVGVGEVTPYLNTDGTKTLQVELYIDNRSDNAIYMIFRENKFDGRSAPYEEVYVSISRTDPHRSSTGVVYIDTLHNVSDLNNWEGTLYLIDDDTYYDPNPVVLDSYSFDLTYKH